MLTKLSYSVTFPKRPHPCRGEFDFTPGSNEQGKSLIIKVVRWCARGVRAA
jgi:hypothetical protein